MSAEVADKRPLVLRRSARNCLDEYRGFRHGVRNVYTLNLRPSRLRELVADLPSCYAALVKDLISFCHFLEQLELDDTSDLQQLRVPNPHYFTSDLFSQPESIVTLRLKSLPLNCPSFLRVKQNQFCSFSSTADDRFLL